VNVLHTDGALNLFEHRGILQADGRFHVFDRRAKGAILGEGVGMVLVKTLERALVDGDRVYAVVKALEINNDGRTAGPSAPSMQAQVDVMRAALSRSGLSAAAVGHVEANGAGTEINDLLELKAVAAVYGDAGRNCEIGSMKPNIGHPLCAEGIASLIKVALMLHHRRRVPFLSAQQPLRHFDPEAVGIEFRRAAGEWTDPLPAAAINSFADGGTNAHVVLQAFAHTVSMPARQQLPVPGMRKVDLSPPPSPTVSTPEVATPEVAAAMAGPRRAAKNFWKVQASTRH
jgi:acyl transferase domain-containing protein